MAKISSENLRKMEQKAAALQDKINAEKKNLKQREIKRQNNLKFLYAEVVIAGLKDGSINADDFAQKCKKYLGSQKKIDEAINGINEFAGQQKDAQETIKTSAAA